MTLASITPAVREAAYDGLLEVERPVLHRAAAGSLERVFGTQTAALWAGMAAADAHSLDFTRNCGWYRGYCCTQRRY